jgi:alcohol dehydrogenase YqhD (iron-dependent ADH family)
MQPGDVPATSANTEELDAWVGFKPATPVREGVRRLRTFWKGIGLPGTLSEMGVGADRLDEMARKATERGPLGNFVKLTTADVRAILELAR